MGSIEPPVTDVHWTTLSTTNVAVPKTQKKRIPTLLAFRQLSSRDAVFTIEDRGIERRSRLIRDLELELLTKEGAEVRYRGPHGALAFTSRRSYLLAIHDRFVLWDHSLYGYNATVCYFPPAAHWLPANIISHLPTIPSRPLEDAQHAVPLFTHSETLSKTIRASPVQTTLNCNDEKSDVVTCLTLIG